MSIGKYEIFHTVVELGSLTKASEALNISQSGVSHAIASLEKDLGFSLLTRNKAGIRLTVNGERMLMYIRDILTLNKKMLQEAGEIQGLEIGTVRIGTFSSISVEWLPGILKKFMNQYPHIKVEVMEGKQEEISQWISQGVIDFGFLMLPAVDFEVLPLKRETFYCVVPENQHLSVEKVIKTRALKKEKLILQNSTLKMVHKILKPNKSFPEIAFRLDDEQAIISMVKNGLGVAILPEIALYNLPAGVKKIPLSGEQAVSSIGIGSLSFKNLSPAAEKFIATSTLWLNENINQVVSIP
ncbi:LysR family transcriptional regulator [Fictibacillus phosphorivorans]|uniref:LysR family transcriptional regulator n=1 Tax=Fictibacillus phosphorivorans TaxID=1221500 RepID=UPI00203F7622|nr:LysR family transcriptional regulator [Fictibacillus phosphorivorans]MCM3718852.1 LysR family transcriptional regulator [Fictibacillus phosphorivorans]MCM3776474.1 LysR family transcriptional regulator [Fictibacillus phosphorivorans]